MNDKAVGKLKKTKHQVEHCLREYPITRNCDVELLIRVLQQFHGVGDSVKLSDLSTLPSFESIRRMRQKFQEQGLFAPTDEKVAIARGWAQDDWKKALGYYVEPASQMKLGLK